MLALFLLAVPVWAQLKWLGYEDEGESYDEAPFIHHRCRHLIGWFGAT